MPTVSHTLRLVLAGALAAAALIAPLAVPVAPAVAATTPRPVGTDVSWPSFPDCLRGVAPAPAFALVGVNDGLPTGTNPCLPQQLAWASTAVGDGRPRVEVYVNAANPGHAKAAWWPTANRTRGDEAVRGVPGRCSGGDTVACAFVYGYSVARDDLGRGVPAGTAARWWIDVESANTWSASVRRNRAVVEGMATAFARAGLRTGLYGLRTEVPYLLGSIPSRSVLAPLPTWIAGAGDAGAAARRCAEQPFANGRVQLAQFIAVTPTGPIDSDIACGVLASGRPRITGSAVVGALLTARPASTTPAARSTYRWSRDGVPLAGATGRTHRVVPADRGHRLTVQVTATRDGYSRSVRTSRATIAR